MLAHPMTLRQLSYFIAVAEEQSITRAAHRLHVAQPSLSQQIRSLERELGGDLIERLPRSIRLTALGRELEPHARDVVLAAGRARKAVEAALATESGELEIATVRSVAVGVLPSSLRRWRAGHPNTTVRLHEFSHRAVLEDRVRSGLADLAIGPRPQHWEGSLAPLGWEEFVVVLEAGDPAGDTPGPLHLEVLSDRRWVLFEPEHGLNDFVTFACAAAGFTPIPAVQTSQVEAAARLAAAGLGPAIVPANAVPPDLDATVLPLDPPVGRELTAYSRHVFSPLAKAYLECLSEEDWNPRPERSLIVP
jgi:DNA-binding transcriptional LysR family regulator